MCQANQNAKTAKPKQVLPYSLHNKAITKYIVETHNFSNS